MIRVCEQHSGIQEVSTTSEPIITKSCLTFICLNRSKPLPEDLRGPYSKCAAQCWINAQT